MLDNQSQCKKVDSNLELYQHYLDQIPQKVRKFLLRENKQQIVIFISKEEIKHPDNQVHDAKSILLTCIHGKLALFTIENDSFAYGDKGSIYEGQNLETGEVVAIKVMRFFPGGWQVAKDMNHPGIVNIYSFGEAYSLECTKHRNKKVYLIMEKASCELQELYRNRLSISTKKLIGFARDLFEISIALAKNNVTSSDFNRGSCLIDGALQHIKLCDFDEYEVKSPSYYIQQPMNLRLVYYFHYSLLCYDDYLEVRYYRYPEKYLNKQDSYSHKEDYLKPEHLPIVNDALTAIEKLEEEAKDYLFDTKINLNNLAVLRKEFDAKISSLTNRYEFLRLKFRSPHLNDKIIRNFMKFCNILSAKDLDVKSLRKLKSQIPDYLFRMEGGAIMDLILDRNLSVECKKKKNIDFIKNPEFNS